MGPPTTAAAKEARAELKPTPPANFSFVRMMNRVDGPALRTRHIEGSQDDLGAQMRFRAVGTFSGPPRFEQDAKTEKDGARDRLRADITYVAVTGRGEMATDEVQRGPRRGVRL